MARMEGPGGRSDLRANLPSTRGSGNLLEVDAWIPSEVRAISTVGGPLDAAYRRLTLRHGRGTRRRIGASGSSKQRCCSWKPAECSQISSRSMPLQGRKRDFADRLGPGPRV